MYSIFTILNLNSRKYFKLAINMKSQESKILPAVVATARVLSKDVLVVELVAVAVVIVDVISS